MAEHKNHEGDGTSLQEVQRHLRLPGYDKPEDVAQAVYNVYQHCLDAYRPWHDAADRWLRYYRGEQYVGRRPKMKPSIVDNECFALVDTVTPKVIENIKETDVMGASEEEQEPGLALGQRVDYAMRQSDYEVVVEGLVDDILKEGVGHCKILQDVRVIRLEPRRIMREPEAPSFHRANYIIDHSLAFPAEIEEEYGVEVEATVGVTSLDSDQNRPLGPPDVASRNESGTVSFASPTTSTPIYRYKLGAGTVSLSDMQRVKVVEIWFRDRTKVKGRDVLLYPEGRVVTIGIGVTKEGDMSDASPNLITLMDRPNGFKRLYRKTGRFPVEELTCYNSDEIWSQSMISQVIPLQDGLNDAWNQLATNMRLMNVPQKVAHHSIPKGKMTNTPGETIHLPASSGILPNQALYYVQAPSIVHQSIPVIHEYKDAIRYLTGVLDIVRGEKPGGVTAYSAIALLDEKAENRIIRIASRVTKLAERIKIALAYVAQDFDGGEMDFAASGRASLDIEGGSVPDQSLNAQEYIRYNPDETRDVTVRVVGTKRFTLPQMIDVLNSTADIDAKTGMGETLLMYVDDPRLRTEFVRLKAAKRQAEQAEAEAQRRHETGIAMGKQATSLLQGMVQAQGRGQPEEEVNSNGKGG